MTPQERLAKIDEFNRTWAAEHDEEYQGYEDFGDFVIYKTMRPRLFGGMLVLRCENAHLKERGEQYLTNVDMISSFELQQARYPEQLIDYAKEKLLHECRRAAAEPPKEAE